MTAAAQTEGTKIAQTTPSQFIALNAEDTVGSSINWYLTNRAIPVAILEAAYTAQGLDAKKLPEARTPIARFRDLCAGTNARIYRRSPLGTLIEREFVCAKVVQTEDARHLTSYSYSANLADASEKARLEQVGTLTYNTTNDTFSWRFTASKMQGAETVDEYTARCLAGAQVDCPELIEADLVFFREFSDEVLSEVNEYKVQSCYDSNKLRDILRSELIRCGCFSLSARGGFWFAPNLGENGPFAHMQTVMAAFEAISTENRFLLLTMPKDERTTATATEVVSTGLMGRVTAVAKALESVVEQTRAGQHDNRLTELAAVVAQGELYSEMLGMQTDGLLARIEAVRGIIADQVKSYGTARPAKVLKAAGGKRSKSPFPVSEGKLWKLQSALSEGDTVKGEGYELTLSEGIYSGVVYDQPFSGSAKMGALHAHRSAVAALDAADVADPAVETPDAPEAPEAVEAPEVVEAPEAPEKPSADELAASVDAIACSSITSLRKLVRESKTSPARKHDGDVTLTVGADPVLGFTFEFVSVTGKTLHAGSATSQAATVKAIQGINA